MCMRATEEGCVLANQQKELKAKVADMDTRLTKVEDDVGKIRSEAQDGFRSLNSSINNLAHDFGDRMNNLDKRIIVEKEKWGETLRWAVKVSIKVLLAGALVAMGVTACEKFFGGFAHGTVPGAETER